MDFKGLKLSESDCLFLLYSLGSTICNTQDVVFCDTLTRLYFLVVSYYFSLRGEKNV